ncbi:MULTISPECIES: class I SAM-dependent methyltransferase [Streptomyces]|uniref:class I SAM-dependent methyltransferase n=1 Tax=Streptomyces TaxID=1883 RepID=UPI0013D932B6|nr:class I SAM-dependent methyltransferase [Streptomyces aureoverticillatus]QIB42356.1 class I SAM-dependent methyltransferase [Streptomyces aureoverticillatus]
MTPDRTPDSKSSGSKSPDGKSLDHLDQAVIDGQAGYSKPFLNLYDLMVYRGTAPLLWRCPPKVSRQLYDTCVGARHMDIGVGSGYLLHHARFPVPEPRITLVDLNPNSLAHTAHRLRRYEVETVRANVLEPLPVPEHSHDSVGMSYLLHCVPGGLPDKGIALAHAAAVVRPGGVVFGTTVLSGGVPVSSVARRAMRTLNKRGAFHNDGDTLDDLRAQLDRHFDRHELTVRGCVGVFRAWTAA